MQVINLDLSVKGVIPLLHAKQGDVGRKFKAILTDGGEAYPVPAGAAVSVWYSGASGTGNYTDVGTESAVSVSGNEITVELITQMLANPGKGIVCLVLSTAGGDEFGMWNINYCVEPRPGINSVAAQEYYTAFSKAVSELSYPDESLSVPGKAADAAATGAALASKAPSGYGLGVSGAPANFSEVDTIKKNGWYAFVCQNTTICNITFHYAFMEVIVWDGNNCRQNLYPVSNMSVMLTRNCFGGAWNPWECYNPPMELGLEYRTTERYNGKPVYVKTVRHTLPADTGNTSSVTTLAINGNVSNVDSIVDVSGVYVGTDSKKYPIPGMGGNGNVFLGYNAIANGNLYLVLIINKDVFKAGQYFNVTFKYTKTTY